MTDDKTPAPTASQIQDMRDTLSVLFPGAVTAPDAKILAKIDKTWRGGVSGYLKDNYQD